MIGRKLASYVVIDKLGEGGMGEVWRASDERLNRMVAIKMLPAALAADTSLRARFEQEARALGALNHPNIVTIYDVGQDEDGRSYMVSELVDGESLRTVLDRGPLPIRKAIDFAGQIAEGMAAAHALGIVHRDLKPENVMVTKSGQVKLLDFGLAKQKTVTSGDRTATLDLSQPGTILGTAGYMSPEQVRAEPVDARSDIFSFGCVLYEMIGGKRAFRATSAIETMHAILNSDPLEFEGDAAKVPPAIGAIIRRCLEKRPEQRFQSAADLAFALKSISTTDSSANLRMSALLDAPPVNRRRNWLWLALGIIAVLVAVAASYAVGVLNFKLPIPQYQRVTFRRGDVSGARFTPDGHNVVYAARWEGHPSRIFLAVPGSPESRDLGIPDGSQILAVSSREELAFLSPDGALERMSIAGGQMRPLLDNVLDADWSPDGNSLAVLRRVKGDVARIEYPIGSVLLDKIASPLESIRVSPDGQKIAFLNFIQGRRIALNVVNRAGERKSFGAISAQTLSNEPSALAWSPKGDEIWFRSLDPSDHQTIYAINMKGVVRTVTNLPGRMRLFDISKDGRVLLSTGSMQFGILGAGAGDSSERDLSCLDQSVLMGISDDGSTIVATVLGDSAGAKGSIYMRKTDGSPAVRVGDGNALRLSPDGKWVSNYMVEPDGSRTFGVMPTGAGENVPVRAPGTALSIVYGWFHEPQRYLMFGPLTGKRWQCFAYDAANNNLKSVCPEGVPDSHSVFLSPDQSRVVSPGPSGGWYAYSVAGDPAIQIRGINGGEAPVGWRADSKSLYVVESHPSATAVIPVWSVDIMTGRRTPWKEIRPSRPIDSPGDLHLWITPDGRAYAYNYSIFLSDLYVGSSLR